MNVRSEAKNLVSRISIGHAIILGLLLGWTFLMTVVGVPAPPGGTNPHPPG